MIESRLKNPDCCPHKLGDSFMAEDATTLEGIKDKICQFVSCYRYLTLASVGVKSWDKDDPEHFYISCPCRTGTVWKIGRY